MSDGPPRRTTVTWKVTVVLPGFDRENQDRLWDALHAADRRLGVIVHNRRPPAITLLTPEADEAAARSYAGRVLAEAARRARISSTRMARAEIGDPVPWEHDITGGPRRVDAPAGDYRTVELGERGRLSAMREGPLGEWFVYLGEDRRNALAGRNLLALLGEVFQLPHGRKERWVYDLIAQLAGHPTPLGIRYACPCCDFLTLAEPPPGTYAICPVCRWEDDNVQFDDPDYRGGANTLSLREARANVERIGVMEERYLKHARPPLPEERH